MTHSTNCTRSAGSDRTYCSPGATVYEHEARQPSSHRVQPSQVPVYHRPSSCCTSTDFGSGNLRTSSDTAPESTSGEATEAWRDIPGYEGLYRVSDAGRVMSIRRHKGRVLRPWDQHGYATVALYRDDRRKSWRVHRLVLTAFERAAEPGEHGRHLNGDSRDNRLLNLAWGSAAENAADTLRNGRHVKAGVTHCPSGHAYDAENTLLVNRTRQGMTRECRACKKARRRPPRPLQPDDPRHGSATGYKAKCRCGLCRAANTAAVAEYRAKHGRNLRTSSPTSQKVGLA